MEIKSFAGEYRFLSNFCESPIEFDGLVYGSAESAFQAQKCEDSDARRSFVDLTASESKRAGRHVRLRPDWEDVKTNIMRDIVRAKFVQNPELAQKLLATGDAILEEGNWWNDRFWGVDIRSGLGRNELGRILMAVRIELALKKEVRVCTVTLVENGVLEVSTPLVNEIGDHVHFYGRATETGIVLTDVGETVTDMESCGILPSSPDKQRLMFECVGWNNVRYAAGKLSKEIKERENYESELLMFASVILQIRAIARAFSRTF